MNPSRARVLVIGAGPAGLASMLCLRRQGIEADWVDRQGCSGGAYHDLYPEIELASPARWTSLPGLPLRHPREYLQVRDYRQYLQHYAAQIPYAPRPLEVTSLRRQGQQWLVNEHNLYEAVVCASGMDRLVWPDFAPPSGCSWMHARQWQGPQAFRGQRLLVIGRGVAAVEIAEEAARWEIPTTVSCHQARVHFSPQRLLGRDVHDLVFLFSWLPRWLAPGYCRHSPTFTGYDRGFRQFQSQGRIRVRPPILAMDADGTAHFSDGGQERFQAVVCATGYRFGLPYLPTEVSRSRSDGHPLANRCRTNLPGLYLMGVHCCRGLSSQFLRGIAMDAPALARTVRQDLQGH